MATTPLQKTPKKSSYFSYIKEVLNSQVPVKVKDYPILVQSPDCVSKCPHGLLTGVVFMGVSLLVVTILLSQVFCI